jgi:hypothetical protein
MNNTSSSAGSHETSLPQLVESARQHWTALRQPGAVQGDHSSQASRAFAVRVPVACGSLTDLTVTLNHSAKREDVNAAFQEAAQDKLKEILQYTEEPLFSSDTLRNPHSCIFDASLTQVSGKMVKVLGWYDNEWAYSVRNADALRLMATLKQCKTTGDP